MVNVGKKTSKPIRHAVTPSIKSIVTRAVPNNSIRILFGTQQWKNALFVFRRIVEPKISRINTNN